MLRRAFLGLSFLLLEVSLLTAQTGGPLSELSLEELMNVQVISSTQQYVRLPEAPSTTFVVTGDQIRKWGIRRLSELIERLVPGAISAEDFDDIILSFRGITADNNLKVLLLLNGHEYNTVWNNGPSSEAELGMMDDIQKVEVLVGPHTAVYGSAAVIGVINIITKSGKDFSGVRVNANYGSGDFKRGGFIAGGRLDKDLHFFISAGGMAADGYDNNENYPLNISRFPPSWRFYGNVNYKDWDVMSRFTRSSRAFYVQEKSATRPNLWTNYDTFFINGRRIFDISPQLRHTLDLSIDSIQTQRHDFTLGTKLRAVGEDRFGAKFTTFYSPSKRHHFVLGGYYRRDHFGDDWEGDNFTFGTTIVNGVVTGIPVDPYTKRVTTPYGRNVYAFFGQDSITFNDTYSLLLGFRYDRVEAPQIPKPDSFSPRIALVITPNERTVFKAMFTSGVSRQLNAAQTSPDSFALGNPTTNAVTDPELLHSFELAASYRPNPMVDVAFNAFYNSLQDIFGLEQSFLPGFKLINFGRIDYVGFEAILSANVTRRAFLRLIHQHVQFGSVVEDMFRALPTSDNKHPSNYPDDVTKILAEARVHPRLSLNANANLVLNNYGVSNSGETLNSGFYSLINANVIWEVSPETEIILSAYNLLNEQKQIPPFNLRAFLPERNLNVNISHRF